MTTTNATATDYAALTNEQLNKVAAVAVMGWPVKPEDVSPMDVKGEFYEVWEGMVYKAFPDKPNGKATFWSLMRFMPATDYNHAAQLRQECERRGLQTDYVVHLLGIIQPTEEQTDHWDIANATPRQITIAAIKAVEGNPK